MTNLDRRLHIILLTRSGCSLCDQADELLNRLAREYPLVVSKLDTDEPEGAALALRTGVVFSPGIVIGAEAVASGRISERRLRDAIERRLPGRAGIAAPTVGRSRRGRSFIGWLTRSW